MKKILYISLITILILFTGCSDFLDLEVKSDYSSGNYYGSDEAAVQAVNAIYNSLYGIQWWVFGDVASDDAIKGGNPGDQADINAIDDFSANSDNGIIATFWTSTYETIIQANNVIEFVTPMQMDATLKNRLLGEAKFLRAFSYFNLINIFGPVPYKDKPQLTPDAIHIPLSDVNTIYSRIEQDLMDAAAGLSVSYNSAELGRATKGAAYGLLAKVYLYQNKYSECLEQISNLEALQLYDLEDNYAALFRRGAEDNSEVIFGLRYVVDEQVTLGNIFNVWMAPYHEGGYFFNAPTQSYVDAFNESTVGGQVDPRLDASIGRNGMPWFNGETFSASWSETGYLVKKYNEDRDGSTPKSQSTIPYHYLRYADVILMKAEALNERGSGTDIQDAAIEVDRVRDRAGLAATTATTQAALREVIRTERRRELGFEFHRFFDLMRWGKQTAETALGSGFTWREPRFYYPIPQLEIDNNNAIN